MDTTVEKRRCIKRIETVFWWGVSIFGKHLDTAFIFLTSGSDEIDRTTVDLIPEFCEKKEYEKIILVGSMPAFQSAYEYVCIDNTLIEYLIVLQRSFHPFRNVFVNGSAGYDDGDFYELADVQGMDLAHVARQVVFNMFSPTANKMMLSNKRMSDPNSFWNGVLESIAVYEKDYDDIRSRYPKGKLIIHPYNSGDMFLSCLYIRDYLNMNGITDYTVLVSNIASQKVGDLFGFSAQIEDKQKLINAILYGRFFGMEETGIKNTHICIGNQRGGTLWWEVDYNTLIQKWVFACPSRKNAIGLKQKDATRIFEENNLVPEKTILISPFSVSVKPIEMSVFESMVNRLKKMGYDCCTNVAGDETPIPGTKAIFLPYERAIDFLDKSAGFIGMRSGLCDIVSPTTSKMVVLHRDFCFKQFSLSGMGLKTENLLELIVDNETTDVLIDKALGFITSRKTTQL